MTGLHFNAFTHQSGPQTACLHGALASGDGAPLVTPIVQSTTYCRDGVGSDATHQYSRCSNPTVSALEHALSVLEGENVVREGGTACFATGLAAEAALFHALLKSGDHVVCGRSVYGGTTRLLRDLLGGLGITATFVDATDTQGVIDAMRPETRLVFLETPANPTLELTDLQAVSDGVRERARELGGELTIAVDNTFLTPVLQRPLELGADVSVYSTTKFIEGHSAALGGALVTADPQLLDKFVWVRKCTGAIQNPLGAWTTLQGLKTLPIRLQRQSSTAARLAEWLLEHEAIASVRYPGLAEGEQAALAERQHRTIDGTRLHGAVVTIELAGGLEAAQRLLGALRLCRFVEHVGSVETLVTHPATMTHADVPRDQRIAAGLTDGLLRISIGLEEPEALLADWQRGLDAAGETNTAAREEAEACVA
ncbi:MAG: trans-sulfuration enzyme family protein [Phycisphaerales bacterium JB040]